MIPNPVTDGLAYDQPICGGRKWPGVASVEGCERAIDVQIEKGKGTSGASTKTQGELPAEPKITFILYRGIDDSGVNFVDYFAEWETYKGIFELTLDDKNPQAITIEHPQFAEKKIGPCIVKKIGDLKIEADGRVTITIDLVENKPKKKSGGTVKGAEKPGVKKGRPRSAADERADELDLENEELTKKIAASWKESG